MNKSYTTVRRVIVMCRCLVLLQSTLLVNSVHAADLNRRSATVGDARSAAEGQGMKGGQGQAETSARGQESCSSRQERCPV